MVNMSDNAKITDVLQSLLFSGGKGNQKQRGSSSPQTTDDSLYFSFLAVDYGLLTVDFYVAGFCTTVWLLLRRTLVRSEILLSVFDSNFKF